MSKSVGNNDDMEELSRLIDEMNAGGQPASEEREIAELLAVATLLKKADLAPSPLPQHLLDQTVNLVIAGLPTKRRINWLYSGALSTVAAVILVIGLHTMPLWPNEVPLTLPVEKAVESQTIPQDNLVAKQSPIAGQAASTTTTSTETSVTSPNSQPIPNKPQLPADTRVKSTPVLQNQLPQDIQSKSVEIPQVLPTPRVKPPTPTIIPFSLPGRLPDSIISNEKSGTVRQVYSKGTPQEIIITQRAQPEQLKSTIFAGKNSVLMERQKEQHDVLDQATSKTLNKVTVTVNHQEVTVEGYLSNEELLKLGESLGEYDKF